MTVEARSITVLLVALLLAATIPPAVSTAQEANARIIIECDGRTAAVVPLSAHPVVIYNWTHSVEWSLISEWLLPQRDGLVLIRVMSKSFGAGHPYNVHDIGGHSVKIVNNTMVYDAWEPIGRELYIQGGSWVPSNISVILPGGKIVVCSGFENATIRILP